MPLHPSDLLLHLVVAFLAPMFLGASSGDINLARLAAMETVNAYRIQNQVELLTVVQIIAFGLATLGSLSLSMADDITLSMILRLRGNANALDRRAERNRLLLDKLRAETAQQQQAEEDAHQDAVQEAAMEASMAEAGKLADATPPPPAPPEPTPAPPASSTPNAAPTPKAAPSPATVAAAPEKVVTKEMWARAMLHNAREIRTEIPHMPPLQRREASIRVEALSSVARELLLGTTPVSTAPVIRPAIPRPVRPDDTNR